MQKTALNLAALISAALLTACGSSADETVANALVPAPTAPNAAEVEAFNASKQGVMDKFLLKIAVALTLQGFTRGQNL